MIRKVLMQSFVDVFPSGEVRPISDMEKVIHNQAVELCARTCERVMKNMYAARLRKDGVTCRELSSHLRKMKYSGVKLCE